MRFYIPVCKNTHGGTVWLDLGPTHPSPPRKKQKRIYGNIIDKIKKAWYYRDGSKEISVNRIRNAIEEVMEMLAREAMREIMEKSDPQVSVGDIAFAIGKRSQTVWDRLSQDNISVSKLDEMARVVGYKVVLVPKDMRLGEGMYKIEG